MKAYQETLSFLNTLNLKGIATKLDEMSSDTISYEVRGHELLRIIPQKESLYFYVHLEEYLLEYSSSRLKEISF